VTKLSNNRTSNDSYSAIPSRILVPTDGSSNANRALKHAIGLAKACHSEITILNVIPAPSLLVEAPLGLGVTSAGVGEYYSRQETGAKNLVEEAALICHKQGINNITSEIVRAEKSIVEEIIELAIARKIDLIVVGTRGLGGFKKLLMGSVSTGVVTHAACDVLVVR